MALSQLKQRAFFLKEATKDWGFRRYQELRPYVHDLERYQGEFVVETVAPSDEVAPLSRTIYTFWTGTNPMSPARRRGWDSLRRLNSDLDVVLVTPDNLGDYIKADHPLHPAYHHLCLTHKSDYLRCYFMNFYGGGYVDVKPCRNSWRPSFETLELASSAFVWDTPRTHRIWLRNSLGGSGAIYVTTTIS